MEESEKQMLADVMKLAQENNQYLRKIDRRQRWGNYWNIFLVIIAVGSALGIYYFLQPYVDQFKDIYMEAQSTFSSFLPGVTNSAVKK